MLLPLPRRIGSKTQKAVLNAMELILVPGTNAKNGMKTAA